MRLRLLALAAIAIACGAPSGAGLVTRPPINEPLPKRLEFSIEEGRIENHFFRDRRVAAHVLSRSGETPRLVVAFPAGNMGVGVWFEGAADLAIEGSPMPVERADGMRGVSVTVRSNAAELRTKRAILGSVRALRDYGHDGRVPAGIEPRVVAGPPVVLTRTTLDGKRHLELVIEAKETTVATVDANGRITLAHPGGGAAFQISALQDDAPLTPIARDEILTGPASDPRALDVLAFLTYEEKLLAGSWQYLTYFGRDTLLSTRLLLPVLRPAVVEAALGAVIERLDDDGDVAHEEDIGEWAVLENTKHVPRPADVTKPVYDYKMVDDDFLLAPVLASYVETHATRADAFFARKTTGGRTFADAVKKNLQRVVRQATPFAEKPGPATLIRIGGKLSVGNWRDSNEGLGRGRIPYDVNAALVPAALRASAKLYALPSFGTDERAALHAAELAASWRKAEQLFTVEVPADEAKRRLEAYAREQGIDAGRAIASIDGAVRFPALALDERLAPIPIQHSDDGFVLMFGEPTTEWLHGAAKRILAPFPAGLRTPVGVVVANPAYSTDASLRAIMTRDHYHGTVIWSWQQALLLSGIRRQLERPGLAEAARLDLANAEQALLAVVHATKEMRSSELWSWNVDDKGWHVVPFGQGKGHHTEANAAQLWSTVYLAIDRAPK